MTGSELIAAERKRQIEKEGWTEEHADFEHTVGELSMAASCYAFRASLYAHKGAMAQTHRKQMPVNWPWHDKRWKPKGVLKDFIRAEALLACLQIPLSGYYDTFQKEVENDDL